MEEKKGKKERKEESNSTRPMNPRNYTSTFFSPIQYPYAGRYVVPIQKKPAILLNPRPMVCQPISKLLRLHIDKVV